MRGIESWVLNYVLNSLWQVPLVFALTWLMARMVRPLGTEEEHRWWSASLLLATLLPLCTVYVHTVEDEVRRILTPLLMKAPAAGATVTVEMGNGHAGRAFPISSSWPYVVLSLYGLAVACSMARMAWGLWQTHRLRQEATVLPRGSEAGGVWLRYAKRFGVLASEIATVPDAPGPMTVGVWRRILLLPEAWVGTVDAEDLDAAIAHECAHMQRYDFAKNLLYRAITLPVSYHPVVWLMHSRVVETREMVCDAMAADAVAGRERYARSLLRLATSLVDCSRSQHVHAIGIFDANNFERRVMNLTMKRMDVGTLRRVAIKAVCVVLGCGTAMSTLAMRLQVAVPAPTPATQSAGQPAAPSSALPASFVVGVPRSSTGQPAQTFKVDIKPVEVAAGAPAGAPADMHIHVLTPPHEEAAQPDQGNGPSQVSAGVMAGNILTKVQPVYPQAAKEAKIQGSVVLDAVIGKDGTLRSLKLVSGPDELARSAWAAVTQWTYRPYLLNGQPTEVETPITVNYSLAQ